MKDLMKISVFISLLLCFLSAPVSWSAGYESVYIEKGDRLEQKLDKGRENPSFLSALKEASMVEHAPPILEGVTSTIRTLLMQFGLGKPR